MRDINEEKVNLMKRYAVAAALMLMAGNATASMNNYIGGGIINYSGNAPKYEHSSNLNLDEAEFYLTGTFGDIPNLLIHGDYIDSDDGYYRLEAQYLIDKGFSLHAGYSLYQHSAFVDADGDQIDAWSEKELNFGAGYTFHARTSSTYFFAQRDNLFGGFYSGGVRHRLNIHDRLHVEASYIISDAMPNEARFGVMISF